MVKANSSLNDRAQETQPLVFDLLVVDGVDAGRRFTLDTQEVAIRRGKGDESGVIQLHDPTVSKRQALIRSGPDGLVIEHDPGATNATRVNGEPIAKRAIAPGDAIQIGGVVLEVHEHRGMALSGLLSPRTQTQEAEIDQPTEVLPVADASELDVETTEMPAIPQSSPFYLVAVFAGRERRYSLKAGVNAVGRHESCDVQIPSDQKSVSRYHVDLVVSGMSVSVVQRSTKAATALNGKRVAAEASIAPGDLLQIGEIILELALEAAGDETTVGQAIPMSLLSGQSLRQGMEQLAEQEERIQREFNVVGSFLDVDVAGSLVMKRGATKPSQIVLSFERWRDWVTSIVEEFDGHALNSNGDELMCFFEQGSHAKRALAAGGAILERLGRFNEDGNILPLPFRLRLGVHTGESLVDREHGYAYSTVLDTAGHLQKQAETNGLLASEDTYLALGEPELMEAAGTLEPDGLKTYRLRTGRLRD